MNLSFLLPIRPLWKTVSQTPHLRSHCFEIQYIVITY